MSEEQIQEIISWLREENQAAINRGNYAAAALATRTIHKLQESMESESQK